MFVSVLGIDPGLTRCGYGFISQASDRSISLQKVGVFTTSPQEQVSQRLAEMHKDISELIEELSPDVIAIERILFSSNVSTAMSVAQVSGLVHSVAASYSIPVSEYSPTEVKCAVTGDGKADKQQIQEMVMRLLGLTKIPKPADAADALAIAITHMGSMAPKKASDSSDSAVYNGSNLHNAIADAIIKQSKRETVTSRQPQRQERTKKRPGLVR
jgi:crossover junction endodeoxyribonuclease RuvC